MARNVETSCSYWIFFVTSGSYHFTTLRISEMKRRPSIKHRPLVDTNWAKHTQLSNIFICKPTEVFLLYLRIALPASVLRKKSWTVRWMNRIFRWNMGAQRAISNSEPPRNSISSGTTDRSASSKPAERTLIIRSILSYGYRGSKATGSDVAAVKSFAKSGSTA